VGYRTSPSGAETLSSLITPSACSGSPAACMWTFPSATAGTTYSFRVYAENTSGLRSAPSNEVSARMTVRSSAAPRSRRRHRLSAWRLRRRPRVHR
jgi:hypothetical protein